MDHAKCRCKLSLKHVVLVCFLPLLEVVENIFSVILFVAEPYIFVLVFNQLIWLSRILHFVGGLSCDEWTTQSWGLDRWTNQFSFRLILHYSRDERTTRKNLKIWNRWINSSTEPIGWYACATEQITPRDDSFFQSHIKDSFKMNELFKNDPSLLFATHIQQGFWEEEKRSKVSTQQILYLTWKVVITAKLY